MIRSRRLFITTVAEICQKEEICDSQTLMDVATGLSLDLRHELPLRFVHSLAVVRLLVETGHAREQNDKSA